MAAFTGTAGFVTLSPGGTVPQVTVLGVSEWSLDPTK